MADWMRRTKAKAFLNHRVESRVERPSPLGHLSTRLLSRAMTLGERNANTRKVAYNGTSGYRLGLVKLL
jgi:hypothetical protein